MVDWMSYRPMFSRTTKNPLPTSIILRGDTYLLRFVKLVQQAGLFVNLCIGPYICVEWNFGEFPVWLKYVPGIKFRTDNEPFMKFTSKIVWMMKFKNMFQWHGGPIIISQIENEFGPQEYDQGALANTYVAWIAKMIVGLNTGVPWIMCKENDAPDPVVNSLNGFYTDGFYPNERYKPMMCTELWLGWFAGFRNTMPHRPVEDMAFDVAKFVQKGGSFVNYYMYHGGTQFGLTSEWSSNLDDENDMGWKVFVAVL